MSQSKATALGGAHGVTNFDEFLDKLEDGLHGGLPSEVRCALKAIKALDHKKDCKFSPRLWAHRWLQASTIQSTDW